MEIAFNTAVELCWVFDFPPSGSPDRSHRYPHSADALSIEPCLAGTLACVYMPLTHSRARSASFADQGAHIHTCRAADGAAQTKSR
jgi:hypothetical protein